MINISGISESRVAPVCAYLCRKKDQSIIIVSTDVRARRLALDLSFFVKDKEIMVLPGEEPFFLRYDAKNHDQMIERLKALKALRTGEPAVVIAPVSAAIKKMTPHSFFEESTVKLTLGEEIDLEKVKADLVKMGYERMEIVDGRGQFSIRGGIIDVFTPDGNHPYRVELFGTEIDSIRTFDEDTQRSLENLKFIEIYPAEQIMASEDIFIRASDKIRRNYSKAASAAESSGRPELADRIKKTRDELCEYIESVANLQLLENYIHYFYDEPEYLWDYMQNGSVMIDDPDRIYEALELRDREQDEDFKVMLERGQVIGSDAAGLSDTSDFMKVLRQPDAAVFTPFPKRVQGIDTFDNVYNMQSRQTLTFSGKMNVLETELKSYVKKGYKVTVVCSSAERLANLKEFTERIGLEGKILFEKGSLTAGIDLPTEKLCWISESDIFAGKKTGRKKKKFKDAGQKIQSFADMREGDYVVHENHGIGRFIGIEQLSVEGEKKDYIKIKYAGNDMLYVPVEQMDIVQKYIGSDGGVPKINKLSGGEWKATKAKAKAAIAVMAKDLIDLYAQRKMEKGYSFGPDTVWQREFEDSFPYEETDDQLRSIAEIKADMEKPFSMDRLLCGDVGFGKTEVAARALFKCVADGKQAAVLVPTTILANQHYYTLKERFENFPFKVEVLSRFRSPAQQSDILSRLEKGQVDLIIGTHRLLSKDVKFKDLGLLVVDEEQRFGVEDKEAIKKLKTNVDVLTLSATPIPRTLNMSLTGIKDMSLIEEPPEERYPVQTYVLEQDDQLIKEIIERELGRGGQVYVVFNRVRGIQQIADKISELVPDAVVAVGHGQMNEHALENVMLSFINGESNVLVSTTIVESGLDIPNANTMIIMDSDRYGLSQLYQLRGRVGRSNRLAYAYLMYQKDKVLTEVAEKRLRAIREFTEFGAGFKVAMRDLEIRGAGNLLGTEQSGHMMNIGYELYCKMVDDAVRALQGEIVNDNKEETSVEIPVSAYIPERYIENETLKLQMYKKIAAVRSYDDEDEILDELLDRFGDVPRETVNLVKLAHIRYLAEEMSVTRIHQVKEESLPGGRSRMPGGVRTAATAGRTTSPRAGMPAARAVAPATDNVKLVFDFAAKNPLSGYALFNLTEKFGPRVFVHGGTEPFIRLTTPRKNMLDDCIEMLEVLSDGKKGDKQ
ncbi:MAG: transcription-repair coupling factor [Firmicutes bacterium]|nr:transcription-repair coupling factor [Bacillota bacterium]